MRGRHFKPVSRTTTRLIRRCSNVPWIADADTSLSSLASKYQTYLGVSHPEAVGSDSSVFDVAVVQKPSENSSNV